MPRQRPRAIAASPQPHTWPAGIPAFLPPATGRSGLLGQRVAARWRVFAAVWSAGTSILVRRRSARCAIYGGGCPCRDRLESLGL